MQTGGKGGRGRGGREEQWRCRREKRAMSMLGKMTLARLQILGRLFGEKRVLWIAARRVLWIRRPEWVHGVSDLLDPLDPTAFKGGTPPRGIERAGG